MAFFLTPRFAPAYQAPQCNPMSCYAPVARPAYSYRVSHQQPQRPQYSSVDQFVRQINELLLSEVDREAQHRAEVEAHLELQREAEHQAKIKAHLELQREAHRQRQQRKRALRARFAVSQIEQGWQVVGDIQGFEQENINIELTDEHTLKISGNTEWQAEKPTSEESATSAIEQPTEAGVDESAPSVALNDHVADNATETETVRSASPDSDTESHKSYQATVEDDYEDLGAEFPSASRPAPAAQTTTPEKEHTSVEVPAKPETPAASQPEQPTQQQPQEEDRVHGSFEKTFRFPQRIDVANVGASFKEGVLRIVVPKAQVEQVRRIAIL